MPNNGRTCRNLQQSRPRSLSLSSSTSKRTTGTGLLETLGLVGNVFGIVFGIVKDRLCRSVTIPKNAMGNVSSSVHHD
jgi:hypothetical protein